MPIPVFPSTKTPFLCSKDLKMRVFEAKSAQNPDFVLGDGCRELSTTRHEPCGVRLAAVRQATDCRNLPRNLPPWRYRRGTTAKSYRRGATAEELPQKATRRGILPRDGSYLALGPAPSGRVIRM